jgi:hypothetical protein
MEMVQHMLEQVGEHVGVTAEEVVSRLIVDSAVYHHTQAAVSRNLLEKKRQNKYMFPNGTHTASNE